MIAAATEQLRVLDLFSGIGGFSLGLERAGMKTVAFCEIEPYARRVLRKHWPTVPLYEDVRTLTKKRLWKEGIGPNVIAGGFPCQDISTAGKGAGIDGERSGLWREFARLIREIRPAWVVAENSPALRTRGADIVLADLEEIGYAARAFVVGAYAVGANHRRDRTWIIANPNKARHATARQNIPVRKHSQVHRWQPEPRVGRVANGVSCRVDRIECLGNAVVPQVVEVIGRAIVAHHG